MLRMGAGWVGSARRCTGFLQPPQSPSGSPAMSLTFWTATYSVRVRSSSTTFVETVSEFGEDFVFFFL